MKLPFYENWSDDKKKYDFFSLMNTNFYRKSVGFKEQTEENFLKNIQNNNKFIEGRLSKKITIKY